MAYGQSADSQKMLEPGLPKELNEVMRRQLVVAMGTRTQRILLKNLRGADVKWTPAVFERGDRLTQRLQRLFRRSEYHHPRQHLFRGRELLERGQYREAQIELLQSIQLDPEASQAFNALALLHWREGRSGDAVNRLEQASELAPRWNYPRINRGLILLEQERIQEAEAEFREAILVDPEDSSAHHGLAKSLLAAGRAEEAEVEVQKAVEFGPGNAYAYQTLGRINERLHRFNEADRAFRTAILLEPGETSFRDDLDRLRSRLSQPNRLVLVSRAKKGSRLLTLARESGPGRLDPRQWVLIRSRNGRKQETHCIKSVVEEKVAGREVRLLLKLSDDLLFNFEPGDWVLQGNPARERDVVASVLQAKQGSGTIRVDSAASLDALDSAILRSPDGRTREAHCIRWILASASGKAEVGLFSRLRHSYPENQGTANLRPVLLQGRLINGDPVGEPHLCCCVGKQEGR